MTEETREEIMKALAYVLDAATVNNGTDRLSLANSGLQYIKVYQGYTSPTKIHKITLIKR